MKNIIAYISAVKDEMGKVTWPSKDEVVQATTLVVSFALVLSVIVYSMDLLVGFIIGKVL